MKKLDSKTDLFDKFENYKIGDLSMFSGGEPIETTNSAGNCDSIDYDCDSGATCNGEPCDYSPGEQACPADGSDGIKRLKVMELTPTDVKYDPNGYGGQGSSGADG